METGEGCWTTKVLFCLEPKTEVVIHVFKYLALATIKILKKQKQEIVLKNENWKNTRPSLSSCFWNIL